jgi:hypothetical protein
MPWKEIPSKPEADEARKFLMDLMKGKLQFPARTVPGMTDVEKKSQELLANYINRGLPAGVQTGIGELTKTVEGGYDPYTSKEYESFRTGSKLEEDEAVNAMRRYMGLVGMDASTPAIGREGKVRRGFTADRLGFLAGLYDKERNRQLGSAVPLIQTSTEAPIRQVQAGQELGKLPREIEERQEEAIWRALIETMLAPYNIQAPVAKNILDEPRDLFVQPLMTSSVGGGGSDLGNIAQIAGAGAMFLSDIRQKENIQPIENSLEKLKKLKGLTYNFIESPEMRNAGIIAQDLEKVLPEGVVEHGKGGTKFVRMDAVIALIVNAIKELDAKVSLNLLF